MELEIPDVVAALALIFGAIAVAGAAKRIRFPAPILLAVVGVAVSFLPGVPEYTLNPDIILFFILPPLLYSAAWTSSFHGFRENLRPIGLLSVGLVLFSTVVIGLAAWWLVPGLPLAAAFALGAIVAPPDAVAATAVGRELGMPRRMVTILQGESLVNDATALTLLRVAVAAVGGGVTLWQAGGMFLLAAVGGVAIGAVLGVAIHWLRRRLTEVVLENAITLFTPFVVYLVAESLHTSGVLAVVVTGLYLGHTFSATSPETRLQGNAIWELIDFVLESIVFALIGLQLRTVIEGLAGLDPVQVFWWPAVLLAVTILARFVWVFPATYLPRRLLRRVREREPDPSWRIPVVVSWAGMRGVVSLAAAFALAADFPHRNLIVFLTFTVVFGTLVIQGLTLPVLIRRVGLTGDDGYKDKLAEANAQHRAARAALERLDEIVVAADPPPPEDIVEKLRDYAENRSLGAWERLGGQAQGGADPPSAVFRHLRQEMLRAERDVFVRMRDAKELDDEVLRRVLHELDLEETMLSRRSER